MKFAVFDFLVALLERNYEVLNQLQMMFKTAGGALTFSQVQDQMKTGSKDKSNMESPFDVCKELMNSSAGGRYTIADRMDKFWVDADLLPLLTQQNYLHAVESRKDFPPAALWRSADAMAQGDILSNSVRAHGNWTLMPAVGLLSTVYPCFYTNGFVPFPKFPDWLGKNSMTNKNKRFVHELKANLWNHSTARSKHIRAGYSDLLYNTIVAKLGTGSEGTQEAVGFMNEYGLIQRLRPFLIEKEPVMEHQSRQNHPVSRF